MEETCSSLWKHCIFPVSPPSLFILTLEFFLSCFWHVLADTDTWLVPWFPVTQKWST